MTIKNKNIASKEVLTAREAADLLNVTTQTIKNYIYSGRLNALKTPGGHHRIKTVDLKSLGFTMEEKESHENFSIDELWEAYNSLLSTFTSTVETLLKALDARDIVTAGHSTRVADMACAVGKTMGFSKKNLQNLKLAALMHDVGKIAISEAILGKPGRLTDQELFLVRKHSEIGEDIVTRIDGLKPVASVIRHSHERFDGRGYPDKIGGTDIELNSRIIAVADAYDYIRSDLSYRKAYSMDESLQEIRKSSGTQFDPKVVSLFTETIKSSGTMSLH